MFALPAASPMTETLSRLATVLDSLDMRAAALFAEDLVTERDRLSRVVRAYLIPRLSEPDRPLTVVITGPTGSGKSTILNSLLGLELAETGALRPTTRTPLVVTTADHGDRFHDLGGAECHVVTARTPILTRMALVDTPDIDSTSLDHRVKAEALIDVADVVVFVTSALRYADRVPWEVLRRVVDRGAPLISVLNRLSPAAAGAAIDYGARLARSGIDSDIVRIAEQRGAPRASIPAASIRELSRRIYSVVEAMEEKPLGFPVATTVLSDVSGLQESLRGLSRLISRSHQAIESATSAGLTAVELEGLVADITPPRPQGGPIRRLLRLPPPPLEDQRLEEWLDRVAARIRARVGAESLATARRLDEVLPFPVSPIILEPTVVILATAIEGWLAHLRRVTEGLKKRDRNLATALLAWRALRTGDDDPDRHLGPRAGVLAAGARADLARRLEVVFSHMAVLCAAMLEARAPRPDPRELGDLVRQANAQLAFVDA